MTEKNAVKSETVSPAREWSMSDCVAQELWEKTGLLLTDTQRRIVQSNHDYLLSLSSQAIGAAAKEAAEKIVCDWSDISTHRLDHQPRQVEAIILAAIEKARTK